MYRGKAIDVESCRRFIGEVFDALGIPFNIDDLVINIVPEFVEDILELDFNYLDEIFGKYLTKDVRANLYGGYDKTLAYNALMNNIRSGGAEYNSLKRIYSSFADSIYEVEHNGRYVYINLFQHGSSVHASDSLDELLRSLLLLIGIGNLDSIPVFNTEIVPMRLDYKKILDSYDFEYITSRISVSYGCPWDDSNRFFEEFEERYLSYPDSEYSGTVSWLIPFSFNLFIENKKFRFPSHSELFLIR